MISAVHSNWSVSKTLNNQDVKNNWAPSILGTDSDCGPTENEVNGHVIAHYCDKSRIMFDRQPFIPINTHLNKMYIQHIHISDVNLHH